MTMAGFTPEDGKMEVMNVRLGNIEKTLDRLGASVESSLTRGGERMGNLERSQVVSDKALAILLEAMTNMKETTLSNMKDEIKDLKSAKNWFIVTMLGAFISQLVQWVTGRR